MKRLMIIEADTNDADYAYSIQYVSPEEEQFIREITSRIESNGSSWTWENGEIGDPRETYKDILTEEEIEAFGDYLPHGEYGIHSINSIRFLDVIKDEEL